RGVRGATTVKENTESAILDATAELLKTLVEENKVDTADIVSITFTLTTDLNAGFPARAARNLGWTNVPLLCAQEIEVPGALPRCLRILMLINTELEQKDIRHIYLNEAISLREDLYPSKQC
ncbi:MAG: chorismate mutase, partial [Candidatus Saccharibacteria bacterium]